MHEHPEAPLIRYVVAGSEWILVNSIQASRDILQTACYSFEKPNWFRRVVGEIAGVGLVNVDGEVHKRHRKVLNGTYNHVLIRWGLSLATDNIEGAFTLPNYRKLLPMFHEKAHEFSSTIEAKVKDHPGDSIQGMSVFIFKPQSGGSAPVTNLRLMLLERVIKVQTVSKMLAQTTLDVIGRASLGVELGSLSTGSSTFHHLYNQLLNLPPVGALIFVLNIFLPVRRWIPLKANRDFVHASSEVQRLLLETIRKRRTEVFGEDGKVNAEYREGGNYNDYLTFMIREKSNEGDGWSDEEILGHVSASTRY
jgi:cytochrome P450